MELIVTVTATDCKTPQKDPEEQKIPQQTPYTHIISVDVSCDAVGEAERFIHIGFKSNLNRRERGKVLTLRLGYHLGAAAPSRVHLARHGAGGRQGLLRTNSACD